jgi:predicted nucleic acid-binding protein
MLDDLQSAVEILPMSEKIWARSYRIARRARTKGLTVPAIDILIFAVAMEHQIRLFHDDEHFIRLAKL